MGLFFDQAWEEMGGRRVFTMGVGNSENLQTESQFEEWRASLWTKTVEFYSQLPNGNQTRVIKAKKEVKESLNPDENLPLQIVSEEFKDAAFLAKMGYEMSARQFEQTQRVKITSIKELRQLNDEGSTLEVTFDLSGTSLGYRTAQNLAIFPQNSDADVEQILSCLKDKYKRD